MFEYVNHNSTPNEKRPYSAGLRLGLGDYNLAPAQFDLSRPLRIMFAANRKPINTPTTNVNMQLEENIENLQLLPDWQCKPDANKKAPTDSLL